MFKVSFSWLSKVSIFLFFVLFTGCSGNKDKKPIPAPPADQAGSAADPDKGTLAEAKSGDWSRREDSDQMDGRKTITYETDQQTIFICIPVKLESQWACNAEKTCSNT